MDYQKALGILELKPNFTEEDLKTAHRKLSKIYHPDKHKEGTALYHQMIIKQQEINAARDCLKNYLKEHRAPNNNKTTFNLNHYKEEKITALKNLINKDETITEQEFKEISKKIRDIIYVFETDVWMSYVTTRKHIDNMYNLCITSIQNILINYVKSFLQKNYIYEKEIEEKINFGTNLVEFYNQLLKIKEKYSKEVKVNKLLDDEIGQYKAYAGYEKLESLVNVCKKNALYFIKQNNFQNIEKEIEKMHQAIKTEVFEAYYALKKKLSDLESTIKNITDESIKNEYSTICNNFESGQSFYDTEESIKKLEELISEYQEIELKKQNQKLIEESINKIYKSLIIRYSDKLKQYNIVTEFKEIKKLQEFLKEILQVFSKGCEEFKNLEFFKAFDNITFTNETSDREIIENAIQTLKQNQSNVYIKITNKYIFDDSTFFCFDEKDMIMYKIGYDTSFRKITQEEFETEYVPLEKLLEKSFFVGKHMRMIGSPIKVLYESDRVVLYYYDKHFSVSSKEKFYNSVFYQPSNQSTDDSFDQFRNKQYVCEMIEKQVKEKIEEYKKKQTPKSGSYSPDSRIYGEPVFNTDDDNYNNESSEHRRK